MSSANTADTKSDSVVFAISMRSLKVKSSFIIEDVNSERVILIAKLPCLIST